MKNGRAWPKKEDAGDIVVREFATMTFGERSEISWWHFQCGSEGTLALPVLTVTDGTIFFVHHLAGWHIVRWERIVRGRPTSRAGYTSDEQQRSEQNCATHRLPLSGIVPMRKTPWIVFFHPHQSGQRLARRQLLRA